VSGNADSEKSEDNSETAVNALRGFDIPLALRRLGGNRQLLVKLARDFQREFSGAAQNIAAALAGGDSNAALALAHGLAGVAATLAAREVHAAAVALERGLAGAGSVTDALAALEAALASVQVPAPA
jgi:two-component system, sensor histidine kinase and response regulator